MSYKTGLALSIRQPWAYLIVASWKPVENRDWPTRVRGMVGIHASKRFDRDGYAWVRETFPEIPLPAPDRFVRGGIVGRAVLVDCVREHPSPWFFGEYGFVLEQAEPLPFMPCKGSLGFFRPALASAGDVGAERERTRFHGENPQGVADQEVEVDTISPEATP